MNIKTLLPKLIIYKNELYIVLLSKYLKIKTINVDDNRQTNNLTEILNKKDIKFLSKKFYIDNIFLTRNEIYEILNKQIKKQNLRNRSLNIKLDDDYCQNFINNVFSGISSNEHVTDIINNNIKNEAMRLLY